MTRTAKSTEAPWLIVAGVFVVALSGRFVLPEFLGAYDARFVLAVPLAMLLILWRGTLNGSKRPQPIGPVPLLVMSFFSYHAASALWSVPGARVGEVIANDILIIVLVYAASLATRVSPDLTRVRFLTLMLLAAVVYVVGSAVSGATSGVGRSVAFGGGPNIFARVMIWGVIAAIALCYLKNSAKWLLVIPPFLLFTVLSASRGALVSGVGTVFIMVILIRRHLTTRQLLSTIIASPILAWVVWSNDQVRYLAERRFTVEDLVATGFSGREMLWSSGTELFWRHPFAGNGMDSFNAVMNPRVGFPYPHNFLLEVGDDLGFVGLAFLAWIALVAANQLIRQRGWVDAATWGMVAAFLFTFLCSMFSGDIFDTRFSWIFLSLALPGRTQPRPPTAQIPIEGKNLL